MKENKNLNEVFNIDNEVISSEVVPIEDETTSTLKNSKKTNKIESNDIQKDYEYTRANLYSLIEKGQEALDGALELAQENELPRAYEVVGQLIKSVSDTADKLMDLQKKIKDIDEVKHKSPTNVTNALFVGSTAELSKLLKNGLNAEDK
jgi:predicted house-cleaning noncanonical NTP pyrophosphatase (MazG superfamily)